MAEVEEKEKRAQTRRGKGIYHLRAFSFYQPARRPLNSECQRAHMVARRGT